ncbi:MAG: D-tyrosyl-tRNA(Tyr) deacylase [Flavobacteriaceae bacterium TMED120]|nr:MAG: D-tyrosyl-tRNA(Tyr) deacylase [Flavobacteriaceae bacterium TMED120]CAI8260320.1 MAG: D-aminoacyl-tRNA deacylase [Flavobacteriaceae bacterium]HCQ24930.1 D-tyrosyl-tRNA(Tyr) deacylase [Flavobacteriaceae bacterium]|tara:strand:+ start:4790 stop:5242 length:453 start_codon:yes stop_codon:yes gene_type:complete
MRVVIQRVREAQVTVDQKVVGAIEQGLLVLVGIGTEDTEEDADWLIQKIIGLRIFNDAQGVMNRSITAIEGEILLISQFTLLAATKKGNRPSYIRAARPEQAIPLYEYCIKELITALGKPIATGVFGAAMKVQLLNDGPVTIQIDSKNRE